jgi:tRNA A37 threonylcarbamoyltransferase TsaD
MLLGGVSAGGVRKELRSALKAVAQTLLPHKSKLCMDNAAMIVGCVLQAMKNEFNDVNSVERAGFTNRVNHC